MKSPPLGRSETFCEWRCVWLYVKYESSTCLSTSVLITLQFSLPSHCFLMFLAIIIHVCPLTYCLLTWAGIRAGKRCSEMNAVFCPTGYLNLMFVAFVFPVLLQAGISPSITSPVAFDILPLKLHQFSQSTPTGLDCVGWKRRISAPGVYAGLAGWERGES